MTSADLPGDSEQTQSHDLVIACSALRCYERLCAAERTPEWLPEVRSARVRHYDDAGRPLVVDYMAGPQRGGYVYAMHYTYDPDSLAVSWESEGPSGTRHMRGTARFLATGGSQCRMLYENRIGVAEGLPNWAREAQLDRPVEEICEAFRRWVEGG